MNAGRPTRPLPLPLAAAAAWMPAALTLAVLALPALAAAAPAPAPAEAAFAVPDDAARLVPPGSTMVAAIASLDAAEVEWQGLAAAFGSRPTDKDYSLLTTFGDGLPGFATLVAHDRPLLVAVGINGLVMGGSLDLTFIFPFNGDLAQLQYRGKGSPFVNLQQCGGYAALTSASWFRTMPTPTPVPLPAGLMAATVDLGTALKVGLPLVEMGMRQLSQATTDSLGVVHPPLIAPQDLDGVLASVRTVARSVSRLDLAIRRDGDRYLTMDRLLLVPGSDLAPGPQAPFKDAAELTAILPPGSDLVQVASMDLTRPFAVFEPLYQADMRRTAEQLPPAAAADFTAWYGEYLGLVPLTAQPVAAGLHVTDAGAEVHVVMKARDASAAFKRVTGLLDRLSTLPVPVRLEPVADEAFPGAEARTYRIDLDTRSLLAPVPGGDSPKVAQIAQVADLFSRLIPEIRLARTGSYLLASADHDRGAMATMITACRDEDRRGPVDPRPAAAVPDGDGHVQEVIAGDLTAMWRWFSGMASDVEGGPKLPPLADLGPLPCAMTMSAWEGGFSGTFTVHRDDLLALARALAAQGALAPQR